jgi:hypothetical protein
MLHSGSKLPNGSKEEEYLECIMSNGTITEEQWIGNDLEGSSLSRIAVLPQHFPAGTEENYEIRTERVSNTSEALLSDGPLCSINSFRCYRPVLNEMQGS